MLSEMEKSCFFILDCLHKICHYLVGKLVIMVSHWLLKFFFLKLNDVLNVVLSTDFVEELCFNFAIRQLVALSKTKIIGL